MSLGVPEVGGIEQQRALDFIVEHMWRYPAGVGAAHGSWHPSGFDAPSGHRD
jgi:hypothetical protein